MPDPRLVPQTGIDEKVIDDKAIEDALEVRLEARLELAGKRKISKEADDAANIELAKLELPEGAAVRVGRFRITRTAVAARAVSFETAASNRLTIKVLDE